MTKQKANPGKKKPGPKPIEIDYEAVEFFCRSQINDTQLARKLHISKQVLSLRLQKDPKLREAREGGTSDGQSIVSDALFKVMLDRYMTSCKDCGKIRFSFDQFFESCPYCDKTEPVDLETGESLVGKHTNVRHKFVKGDTNVMIFWAKNHLNMSDKITHKGDEENPIAYASLADLALRAAAQKKQKDREANDQAEGEESGEKEEAVSKGG